MDKSLQYTHVIANFDSVYNVPLQPVSPSMTYIPISSSMMFSTTLNRPSSPLFRRCVSPPPRQPISTASVPKFNFDLYKMNDNYELDDYHSPSYRPTSPLSHTLVHHYPINSPRSCSTSELQTVEKLRQINDELYQTLAHTGFTEESVARPHYHIHHYPISQYSYRSRSPSEERRSPTELKVSSNIHKARVTYKIHIPSRHQDEQPHRSSYRKATSNLYSSDDSMIVDLYGTRHQGFIKQIRKHSPDQSPWLVDGISYRSGSYSDTNRSRPPQMSKVLHYGDKPIKSHHRPTHDKERPSSSSVYVTSRNRFDNDQFYTSNTYRRSNDLFLNGQRLWRPSSKQISDRRSKYFEPISKPEHDTSTGKHIDGTESEPISQRKLSKTRTPIRTSDPKMKKRIANAESIVKSAWEPTVTGLTPSNVKEPTPTISEPIRKPIMTTPPKTNAKSVPSQPKTPVKKVVSTQRPTTDTGRSSISDVPAKPIYESTPRNENNNDNVETFFDDASEISEAPEKPESQGTPSSKPETPTTEQPKPTVTGEEKDVDNDESINQNDPIETNDEERTPADSSEGNDKQNGDLSNENSIQTTPIKISTPERQIDQPKSTSNENGQGGTNKIKKDAAAELDINEWLNDATKEILGSSKKNDVVQPLPKSNPQKPSRPKEEPPSTRVENPDHNLYKPPFGPKKNDQKPVVISSSITDQNQENPLDDFFS